MRRPPPARLGPRALVTLLAGLGSAAACSGGPGTADCPGVDQATFVVAMKRIAASCPGGGPASGFDSLYRPTATATLTVAFSDTDLSGSGAAAICTGRHDALPLTGTHAGDDVDVSLETTGGAVLAACDRNCLVDVRQAVTGTLVRDPASRAVVGFSGTLEETDTPSAQAVCGTSCAGACNVTWRMELHR